MLLVHLLVNSLSTWRVSNMLVNEGGPFGIFKFIREMMGIQHDYQGNVVGIPDDKPLLSCLWCTSVWVAGIMMFVPIKVKMPFCISALVVILDKLDGVVNENGTS